MGVEFLKIKEVDEAIHSVRLKVKLIFHHLTGL